MSSIVDELIQLENVSKVYRTADVETRALSNVSITIARGEYVAISGPSGSGKTTLLSLIGLLDTPTEGSYRFDEHDVLRLTAAERARIRNRQIGFIFQSFNLIGDLTVAENVDLPLAHRGLLESERKARVKDSLEQVGMLTRANHYPSQLSGGQQQRVAVARAIIGRPKLLLADEPTGNLDSRNGELIMSLLRQLHDEGVTICMVTHDSRYDSEAGSVIHLFDGEIILTPESLDDIRRLRSPVKNT
jgi:putative ABC transport system ATP-binding protein